MKVFAWNNNREKDTVMTPYDSIKYCRQMLECGFMSMDPLSGYIKAWVGGIDFKNFQVRSCKHKYTQAGWFNYKTFVIQPCY